MWSTLYWHLYWFTVDNFNLLSVFLHGGADHLMMIFSFLWDFRVAVLYTVIMMIIPYGRNNSPTAPCITQLINPKSNFLTPSKKYFWKMVYPPTHFAGSGGGVKRGVNSMPSCYVIWKRSYISIFTNLLEISCKKVQMFLDLKSPHSSCRWFRSRTKRSIINSLPVAICSTVGIYISTIDSLRPQ